MHYGKFSKGVQLRIFHGLLGRKCSASGAFWVNILRTPNLEFPPFGDLIKRTQVQGNRILNLSGPRNSLLKAAQLPAS